MNLSDADLKRWDSAVRELPRRPGELMRWARGPLRNFLRCKAFFIAHGDLSTEGVFVRRMLSDGFPRDYLAQIHDNFTPQYRGSLAHWLEHGEPVLVHEDFPPAFASIYELEEIREYGMGCIAIHGVADPMGKTATVIGFAGIEDPCPWHLGALWLVAPVVDELLRMEFTWPDGTVRARLDQFTQVQRVIAREVGAGYNLEEISTLLRIPVDTVSEIIEEVYGLLGVENAEELIDLMRPPFKRQWSGL